MGQTAVGTLWPTRNRFSGSWRPLIATSGSSYQNFIDSSLRGWERAYYGPNLDRLTAVKRAYDPDDVFRFRQGIAAGA